jgi:Holliday junction resolvase RusA-like endonuclease
VSAYRLEARILGDPKGQPRARAYNRGGKAGVYDPGTANGWKAAVAAQIIDQLPAEPIDGPVAVSMRFLMPRPQRLMRQRDPVDEIEHIGTPDADNLAKAVMDVCNDVRLWNDDRQVADLFVQKRYTAKGGRPGLLLVVESIES